MCLYKNNTVVQCRVYRQQVESKQDDNVMECLNNIVMLMMMIIIICR